MKSYMFMLQRRVIKYSLLLLKLAVMPHHSYPLSFRCLDSAMSERQGRLRAVGLGSRERRGFKPHLTHVDKLFKGITVSSIDMFMCWDGIVARFTSSCLVAP